MESTAGETILFLSAVNNMFPMHVKILIEVECSLDQGLRRGQFSELFAELCRKQRVPELHLVNGIHSKMSFSRCFLLQRMFHRTVCSFGTILQ